LFLSSTEPRHVFLLCLHVQWCAVNAVCVFACVCWGVLRVGSPSPQPRVASQAMGGVSVADCTALHIDFVVHPAAPAAVGGGTLSVEVCVFVRSVAGDLRVLGRACVPLSASPFSGEFRVVYDAWESLLCVGVGAGRLPVLQVRSMLQVQSLRALLGL
jgi:hypothetical protein